ncbi:MAG: 50S ribosomal protein L25 [Deltaproteobacteria bacterium]|nr:50S ribosomal protein L25 [Deltaproteobacteria bacterium]MCB9788066.1 50S ribosomal protein L25 [Deltaproteobacteria bacterium]
MEHANIEASNRTATGKGPNRRLRAAGAVPAVVYGETEQPVSVSVVPKEMTRVLKGPWGRNTIIDLAVEGESSPRMVIVRDYQVHPWRRTLVHVDFWQITEDKQLVVEVPFERAGRSAGERIGAKVTQTCHSVKVRCKPADIPTAVVYDMTTMPSETLNITISQVPMPDGVEAVYKHDFNVLRHKMPVAVTLPEGGEADGKKAKKK